MLTHPILALDHGDSRIGLACTDPIGIAVHPLATVERERGLVEVSSYITGKRIQLLVIGLPLRHDGSEGDSAVKARAFAQELRIAFPELPQEFIDESFTTVEASAKLHSVGLNAKKQKGVIDQAAAMEILHRYLELKGEGMHDLPPPPL